MDTLIVWSGNLSPIISLACCSEELAIIIICYIKHRERGEIRQLPTYHEQREVVHWTAPSDVPGIHAQPLACPVNSVLVLVLCVVL